MATRVKFVLTSCAALALLLAPPTVRAGDEEKCRAKGWDYSRTEVKGDERIVHCKKPKPAGSRGQPGQAQQESPADQEKTAGSAPQREPALAVGGRLAAASGTPDSWDSFEADLRFPEGLPPREPLPAIPIAEGLAAAAGAAWAWVHKNRRTIAGTLIAIAAICAIVVLLKSPPPPLVAVASRLGLAGWIAGPTGTNTSDSRIVQMSGHALEQMAERVITMDQVRQAAQMPSFPYFHQGVWKTGYYDPTTRIFVGTYDKLATTVIGNVKPQYISSLISKHP